MVSRIRRGIKWAIAGNKIGTHKAMREIAKRSGSKLARKGRMAGKRRAVRRARGISSSRCNIFSQNCLFYTARVKYLLSATYTFIVSDWTIARAITYYILQYSNVYRRFNEKTSQQKVLQKLLWNCTETISVYHIILSINESSSLLLTIPPTAAVTNRR